jgi:uncharacterized protein YbjT (DUF2867 family)
LNPTPHAGKSYPLYGAVEMNHAELARTLSEVLGREIRYEDESFSACEQRLSQMGLSEHFIQHVVSVYRDYQDGVFAGTNDLVETITGRKPVTVGEYVKANIELFQPNTK